LAFGADVANGLGKTVNGTEVKAGPESISTAFQALSGGSAIDYVGASGPLNFNLKTGEAPADVETWCIALDQNGTPTYVSGVQYYDATANQVTDTFQPCCKDPSDECDDNNECCSGTCAAGTCM
jgi:branched-chain amino acid transport system substrate-binding protein